MHACGHDMHATWAVGAGLLLARHPAAGDVLVVLQPAEEVGEGAKAILETGALDDVKAIFGGHVDRRFAVGQVVADAGPLAASADTFEIELVGKGAHGARPHESADPIVGAAALITALQTIVSRRIDPAAAAVVTVGSLHAGTAPNVIPERAILTGTLRATTPETRAAIGAEVRRLAESVAGAYELTARATVHLGTPPIVNPTTAAAWAQRGRFGRARGRRRRSIRRHEHGWRGLRVLSRANARLLHARGRARGRRATPGGALAAVHRGGGEHLRRRRGPGRSGASGVSRSAERVSA